MNKKEKEILPGKWDSQIRKGLLDFVILLFLNKKEYYGYDLIREINQITSMNLSEGTIYPLLNRLRKEEVISSKWVEMESGVPRKYYKITESGKIKLDQIQNSWETIVNSIDKIRNRK